MKRLLAAGVVMAALFGAVLGTADRAMAAVVVVRPAALNGWGFFQETATGSGALVPGPGGQPSGAGSAILDVDATGREILGTVNHAGTRFDTVTDLEYSTMVRPGSAPSTAASLQFDVDYDLTDSTTTWQGRLVFEPYLSGAVVQGVWQTWSPLAGVWWGSGSSIVADGAPVANPCTMGTPCTWATVLANWPDAGLRDSVGVTMFKAGGPWAPFFIGWVDAFTIGISGSDTTYDFEPETLCTTDCYVDAATGNDAWGGDTPLTAKKTIQAAVFAVAPGGTVHVAAGTYVEQIDNFSKSFTLDGAGIGSTIIKAPASLLTKFTTSAANKPVVYIHDATGVTISDVTVDGDGVGNANYRISGIAYHNAGGTVTDSEIVRVRETPLSGTQHGVALYALNADATPRTLIVTNNTISDYQKNGMALNGDGLTATVSGNTVTGAGPTSSLAQNGIQIGFGAVGSITGNTVGGNECIVIGDCVADPTSAVNADGAAGILLYTPGASTITVDGNTLTNNQYGIWTVGATDVDITNNGITGGATHHGIAIWDCDQWCGVGDDVGTTGTISDNTISGHNYGILHRDFNVGAPVPAMEAHQNSITGAATAGAWSNVAFDAIDNWWGSANGPAHATNRFNVGAQGDAVSDDVAFVPWLDAAPPAGVSFAPVTTTSPVGSYASIQAGVNASSVGGTVNAVAGTFTENVTVGTEVEIAGAGQGATFVIPQISMPICSPGSICPGSSNVFLVQANDVEIRDLTIDGDNPALTSGVVRDGADLDARNGIITNHTLGTYNNLHVHDLTVNNIYLRGIYASSGGTFTFEDNTIDNVQGEFASIAMFNFGGAGIMRNNTVSDANDAIASNWSRGTSYLDNVVTSSGSGVHTDNNGGSGGVGDLLEGNSVSNCDANGYGVWTFASYRNITVRENTVTNCAVGLAAAGQQAAVTSSFIDNEVDGMGLAGSTGVYTTTSLFGFGSSNGDAYFTGNKIVNAADGFYIESEPGYTNKTIANFNEISGHSNSAATAAGTGTFDADLAGNWWGNDTGPAHALNLGGTANGVSDDIAYSPWVGFGDASGATGFQLDSPMTWFANVDVCYGTCVQRAVDFSSNGDTVKAKTGVFPEHVIVNKSITLTSASLPVIDGGGIGDVVTITADNVTVSNLEIRNGVNALVIAAGADNALVTGNELNTFTSAGLRGNASTGQQLNGNTITGPHTGSCVGGFWGMFLQDVAGTVDGNTISGIGNGLTTGCQEGRAIEAKGSTTIAITDNDISQYQKSGIIVRDTVNATITGNTTAGEGPTNAIAMNGITVTSTGTTIITGNHTSGHRYNPVPTQSCGILLFGNTATVSGNDSTADEVGICAVGGNGTQILTNTVDAHSERGIYLDEALNVLVDNNDIDGQGSGTTSNDGGSNPDNDNRYYGIYAIDSTGTLSDNIIAGITHGPANGTQSGVGIRLTARVGQTSDMDILRNTISGYQKNGMVVTNVYGGASVHADIDDNTVTGAGPINYIAQNGIQVSGGASATITNNDVSGHDYTPFTWAAIGLLIWDAADGGIVVANNDVHDNMEGMYVQQTDDVDVNNNTFTDNYDASIFVYLSNDGGYHFNTFNGVPASSTGVYIYDVSTDNEFQNNDFLANAYGAVVDYSSGDPLANHIVNNDFIGNTQYGVLQLGTLVGPVVDAEDNWWNACDGPSGAGPGSGDAVSTNVDFTPWEHGFCDSDNDLLTDDAETNIHFTVYTNPDTDGDGCADGEEVLFTAPFGGQRDPNEFWDFFDVTGDKFIDFSDTLDVLGYFGDPGTSPAGNLRDRTEPFPAQPWRTGEFSDGVDITDALVSLDSFGHDCTGAP